MQRVFVLDTNKIPLMPCSPKRARLMLERKEAAVFRRYPFTIILKKEPAARNLQPLAFKVDPGSKTTGLALVLEGRDGRQVIWGAELQHRGSAMKADLLARCALRFSRRSRKTRYRPARFMNRTKPAGWLPPSLMHRVFTTTTWAKRLDRLTSMDSVSMELVSFDTQRMQNAEIHGEQYQKGTLHGTELRAYLLNKWEGKCAYCGKEGSLEIEHLVPRSRGGSNRVSNLVVACRACNTKKGTQTLEEFLAKKPAQLRQIQAQLKIPLHDTAAVNATKYKLLEELKRFGYPVEIGSGAQTSFNRQQQKLDKAHWIDAACVGDSGSDIRVSHLKPLRIKCTGHGTRQMCRTDKYGFPRLHKSTRAKTFFGFKTGDIVQATIPSGKNKGQHQGRVACRATGSFDLKTAGIKLGGVSHRFLTRIFRLDGYEYAA